MKAHIHKSVDYTIYADTPRKHGQHGGPKVDRREKRKRKVAEASRRRNRR